MTWKAGLVLLTLGLVLDEAVDLGNGSVEGDDSEAMVGSVQNQVLAHDRKANETEITTGFGLRRANLEVGQSRTRVSILVVNGEYSQGGNNHKAVRIWQLGVALLPLRKDGCRTYTA